MKLAHTNEIPEGKSKTVIATDGTEIALFNIEGHIYALNNACPHLGGPLADGEISDCVVTCPWHGRQFDVKTGACENVPGQNAKKINIEVVNGEILLK